MKSFLEDQIGESLIQCDLGGHGMRLPEQMRKGARPDNNRIRPRIAGGDPVGKDPGVGTALTVRSAGGQQAGDAGRDEKNTGEF